jgi:uncharacterized membrane protein YbhN (UPF0104 family)
MLSHFLMTWILFLGMGENISFWMVAGLWSVSYFITLLPVSINGLGVQEVSVTFLFYNYGHVSMPSALTMGILIRTFYAVASLPGALFLASVAEKKEQKQIPGTESMDSSMDSKSLDK